MLLGFLMNPYANLIRLYLILMMAIRTIGTNLKKIGLNYKIIK